MGGHRGLLGRKGREVERLRGGSDAKEIYREGKCIPGAKKGYVLVRDDGSDEGALDGR